MSLSNFRAIRPFQSRSMISGGKTPLPFNGQRRESSVQTWKSSLMFACLLWRRFPASHQYVRYGFHYCDVIMGAAASQITSHTIVYSTVYSDADQRKHQNFASLPLVRGIHRGSVDSPHKWPVTRKMFSFDDVIIQKNVFDGHRLLESYHLYTNRYDISSVHCICICVYVCVHVYVCTCANI